MSDTDALRAFWADQEKKREEERASEPYSGKCSLCTWKRAVEFCDGCGYDFCPDHRTFHSHQLTTPGSPTAKTLPLVRAIPLEELKRYKSIAELRASRLKT